MRKIWRVGEGLVGMAGDVGAMLMFLKWLKTSGGDDDWPAFRGRVMHALVVSPTGKIQLFESGGPEPCSTNDTYCAIGSASDIALGALYAGASARAAVRAAIKHHAQCKPPIRSYKLRGYE
jgi:hypothetical protein